MEVHQSLPAQYLHNPYLVKSEQTSSGSDSRSPPPNEHLAHTVTTAATSAATLCRQPGAISAVSTSSQSTSHTLYGHGNSISVGITARMPSSSTTHQNGRPLTADRKRPYNCNMCSSRFGSKMELEEHQNSHTGQKPFECNMCKARFNRRSTLWNHKRIHSDDKPFECNVCRMTFKWKNSLKCHKEMHQRKNEMTGIENDPMEKTLTYATAAKRRHLETHEGRASSSNGTTHNNTAIISGIHHTNKKRTNKGSALVRSVPTTSATSSLIDNAISATIINNVNNNNNNSTTAQSLIASTDSFMHTPLQTDGFFGSQKSLSISDHKELDSLLNSTSRLSSMLKEESVFKTNLCDDLASSLTSQGSVFDTKQEMNLFHTNPFMVFGAHQLQSSVQNFSPSNLTFPNSNGSCGDYFHLHINQSEQMGNNQQQHQQQQQQQQSTLPVQTQYSDASSQAADMLLTRNHNVITYQTQVSSYQSMVETPSLIAPAMDYSVTPNNIEYMLNNYPASTISAVNTSEYVSQRSESVSNDTPLESSKEVPQVSW